MQDPGIVSCNVIFLKSIDENGWKIEKLELEKKCVKYMKVHLSQVSCFDPISF